MKTMTKTKRNLVLIILCLTMLAALICPASAVQTNSGVVNSSAAKSQEFSYMQISSDYTEIATSGNLSLSADLSSGLFAIKNLNNGYVWYSVPDNSEYDSFTSGNEKNATQSLMAVGYVAETDEVSIKDLTYLYTNSVTPEIEQIENGLRITYNFEIDLSVSEGYDIFEDDEAGAVLEGEHKIVSLSIPLVIKLDDGHLVASVDLENAKIPSEILVCKYDLLPYFVSADWTASGYMFVPDGSGALIDFSGHENATEPYSELVYGDDLSLVTKKDLADSNHETVRMPVFGLANDNGNAVCGIITDGETAASVTAAPHNDTNGYNNAYATLNARITSFMSMFGRSSGTQQVYRQSDNCDAIKAFTVEYYFLNGNNADYVGMAKTYRDYLLNNDLLAANVSQPTLNVDLYGAIDVEANFMGFTYSKLNSLTSYKQAEEIAKALKDKNIDNLSLRYIGWANNGVTNKNAPSSAKPISLLGGNGDYQDLVSYAKKNNVSLTNDVDLLTYTDGKNKESSKTAFGSTYYKYQYLRSVYAYDLDGIQLKLLNPVYLSKYADKTLSSYKNLGVDNISFSTLSDMVYSSLKRGKSTYRTEFVDYSEDVLKNAAKMNLKISGESANAYTFKYLNKIYKAPTYSSAYNLFDSEVPFYQIVLHGYTSMTGDAMVQSFDVTTNYLKCVESGIELLWSGIYEDSAQLNITNYDDLYGSNYKLWIEDAAAKYAEYQPLLEKIYDKEIVSHKDITEKVTETLYDNGIKVYVNYSDTDYKYGKTVVPAMGYVYKEG